MIRNLPLQQIIIAFGKHYQTRPCQFWLFTSFMCIHIYGILLYQPVVTDAKYKYKDFLTIFTSLPKK